jgi:polysaccharide export outer membrane protein
MFRTAIVFTILVANIGLAQSGPQNTPELKADASPALASSGKSTMAPPGFADRNARYRLQAGDTFEVIFEFSPEFTQTVTVQPDGFVTLKGIGDEKVAGLTTPETIAAIGKSYSGILKNPVVTISLKEVEKPSFVADGQLNHPGKYPLRSNMTLIEAIAIAGGINENAKHSEILLFRRVSNQWMEAKVINYKDMLKRKDISEDVVLQPGDLIYVPQNGISKMRRYIPAPGLGISATPPL